MAMGRLGGKSQERNCLAEREFQVRVQTLHVSESQERL